MKSLLITGGNGFIARSLFEYFFDKPFLIYTPNHAQLDMLDPVAVQNFMAEVNPDVVIHTAMEGTGKMTDTHTNFLNNLTMRNNLVLTDRPGRTVFLMGSGAEFNRTRPISKLAEDKIERRFPLDWYGLAKSIQSQRVDDFHDAYVLRLFGCFGPSENDTRFIKRSILNLLAEKPIEIHQNRAMDFFYVEDVGRVITHILEHGGMGHRDFNLVYKQKTTLKKIAVQISELFEYSKIVVNEKGMADSYTGDGTRLQRMGVPLIGLKRGIGETVSRLVMVK